MQAVRYVQHLHGTDAEGYTGFLRLLPQNAVSECVRVSKVLDMVTSLAGEPDAFMTPNTFYRPTRRTDAVRQLQALFVDLDLPAGYTPEAAIVELMLMVDRGDLPRPTMTINSGRGVHLYWKIKHAPKQALATWQELQDMLYHRLKHLGADRRATDAARVLRLPDTVNSRNGEKCRMLSAEETVYDMRELRTEYLRTKVQKKKPKTAGKVHNLFNSYSLHVARASDLQRLVKMRGGEVTGYRNQLLYMFTYWRGVTIRDEEILQEVVQAFNKTFTEPESVRTVAGVVRSSWRAVGRFISYEQGIRSGEPHKRPAGDFKGGYWLKSDTIINTLDITPEEQRHMKTIIGKAEKYRRSNERRKASRRNDDGRTPQGQRTHDLREKIAELRAQGLTLEQIASEVGMNKRSLEYHVYHLRKK